MQEEIHPQISASTFSYYDTFFLLLLVYFPMGEIHNFDWDTVMFSMLIRYT
jgi:hypothetical protein